MIIENNHLPKTKDCDWDSDEMKRDRVVFGTNSSSKIYAKVTNEGNQLTLDKTIQFAFRSIQQTADAHNGAQWSPNRTLIL